MDLKKLRKLIREITSKDAWLNYYSDKTKYPLLNGNEELFNKINNIYTDNLNNFNKGIFTWLYNLIKNNNLKEEDFYKAKNYVTLFNKFINRIPKESRDINKYKSLSDLYDVVKEFEGNEDAPTSKQDELRQIKEKEVKKVFENGDWLVMIPLTERASCLIGKGTQWCTAADESDNMFDNYNSDGPLYVIVNKDDNSKYQLHFESNQIMDENDRPVPATHFFDYILANDNDVVDFFQGASEKFWDFILETSSDDMAEGWYSEIFYEALNSGSEFEVEKALDVLRGGEDEDAVRTGFVYEQNPDKIKSWQVEQLLKYHINDEGFDDIMEHLVDIEYDFDKISNDGIDIYGFIKAKNDLKKHKLEINHKYKLEKGILIINKIITKTKDDKYFDISIVSKDESNEGKEKKIRGNVDLETLLNYIHQGQLFESNIRKIRKLVREIVSTEVERLQGGGLESQRSNSGFGYLGSQADAPKQTRSNDGHLFFSPKKSKGKEGDSTEETSSETETETETTTETE